MRAVAGSVGMVKAVRDAGRLTPGYGGILVGMETASHRDLSLEMPSPSVSGMEKASCIVTVIEISSSIV